MKGIKTLTDSGKDEYFGEGLLKKLLVYAVCCILARSMSMPPAITEETEADDVTDTGTGTKQSKPNHPMRLNSLQIPTRYSTRSDTEVAACKRRSSMARNAIDDCCIQ